MIDLEGLGKTYGGRNFEVTALRHLTLRIPRGQFVSVVGKSGSGKSTLLKILGLLDFDYAGRYLLDGMDYRASDDRKVSAARRKVGYVFQDFQLIGRYTVQRNLEIASVVKTGALDSERIASCLEDVGLADKAQSYPDELSGGQKQRVAIARAVLAHPDLIIADEPTGALDVHTGTEIMRLLTEAHTAQGCAIVLVTHDRGLAEAAERVIELVDGSVENDLLR